MDIKELNNQPIKDYLAKQNIYPVKDRGYYGMYYSPFREDKSASLKVDYDKNLWIDFGSKEGGTLVDLVMRINNYTLKDAVEELERYNTSVSQYNYTTVQQQNLFSLHGINVLSVNELTNSALLDYLNERKIDINAVGQYCKEVRYSVNNKEYFAIGFENRSGGYELRNKYFKGCTSKDISLIRSEDKSTCLVFEGFMDYLSFLILKGIQTAGQDAIVLNSVANLSKTINLLKDYKEVYTYLDNDEAGRKATIEIRKACLNVSDLSVNYANHKDLNEYLVSTKQAKKLSQSGKKSGLKF